MKKPTLEKLKKRPSLWVDKYGQLVIVYPDGTNDFMFDELEDWEKGRLVCSWNWMLTDVYFEFVSWL